MLVLVWMPVCFFVACFHAKLSHDTHATAAKHSAQIWRHECA